MNMIVAVAAAVDVVAVVVAVSNSVDDCGLVNRSIWVVMVVDVDVDDEVSDLGSFFDFGSTNSFWLFFVKDFVIHSFYFCSTVDSGASFS